VRQPCSDLQTSLCPVGFSGEGAGFGQLIRLFGVAILVCFSKVPPQVESPYLGGSLQKFCVGFMIL
jgi:hypothetical protein